MNEEETVSVEEIDDVAEIKEQRDWLETILRSIGDAVVATDSKGIVKFINAMAQYLTGWREKEALGKPLAEIYKIVDANNQLLDSSVHQVINGGNTFCPVNAIWLINKNKVKIPIDSSVAPIKRKDGTIQGAVVIFRDCSDRRRTEEQIKYLSYYDKLTGLYNRAYLENELQRLDTERQLPITIIMGDINNLKLTNDAFGHEEGDKLLVKTTQILKNVCRQEDVVARWAGDEFYILLPKTDEKAAIEICRRIIKACNEAAPDPLKPSISLGVASKTNIHQSLKNVMNEAEDRMYQHKLLNTEKIHTAMIAALVNAIEEKKFESEGHAWRMQQLCVEFGYALKLPEWMLDDLVLAVTLHDIGKVTIPEKIIKKPSKLSPQEWRIVKKYPEKGYRLVIVSEQLAHIASIILALQERWDGFGYPRGLKGKEIPLLARLISIVHAFDVMTHHRPYKKAVTTGEAFEKLTKKAGSQFDPELVEQFITIFKNNGLIYN